MNNIQLIEDNVLTYYKAIARLLNGDFIETDEVAWFITGRRSLMRFNGVLRTVVSPDTLSRVAEPILKTFTSQNLPFFWADLGAPGLSAYLNASGIPFEHVRGIPAMSRALANLPRVSLSGNVEVARAQSPQDQADWLQVLMEGFAEPEKSRLDFQEYLANSLVEPQPVFEHFLAREHGKPCAISTLLHAQSSAGIYHVATLPSHRGRGLGTALTLFALESAKNAGHTEAILFATPSGFPIYQRLGFETVMTGDLFVWSGHE